MPLLGRLIVSLLLVLDPQQAIFRAQNVASQIPTLNLFLGKTGIDTNRATTGFNSNIFPTDQTGSPLAPTTGSLLVMTGEWPDAEASAGGYPATCASHCAPTFTDNNSNTLTPVFTLGNCLDTGSLASTESLDHGFYYEANIASATSSVTEVHPAQVSNSVWDIANFYNVATSSVVDGSSCLTNQTPANNTAPNITGTGFTITGTNDLILVAVDDDTFIQANAWSASPITVPAGCTLLRGNPSKASLGAARVVMQCTASPGTFTPKITIAQTTHDTFTIYAVAFKAGNGGTAPTTGSDFHVASQILTSAAGSYQYYPGCPAGTPAIIVTDDAGSLTALTDSNSNTYTSVNTAGSLGGGGIENFYTLTPGTINPNTFTITATQGSSGNVDVITTHCVTATSVDTGLTAGTASGVTMVQVKTYAVSGAITTSTGSGNCLGTAGTLVTCTGIPVATPGESGDILIGTCEDGNGPMLQPTQPSGTVAEYIGPAALANVTLGDSNDYLNGDFGFHYWTTAAPTAISWGFTAQQNATGITCLVAAFHK